MNQLTQKLKDGSMHVLEVPLPLPRSGEVLVRNHYSVISAGTEGSTVRTARKGLIGKARERPQQLRQVIDTLRAQGPVQTYRAVMKKLDAYSPLGYSCAGEVIGAAPDVEGFRIGDPVACAGLAACHAEAVCVPANLCVRLRPGADLKQAAYNTLGAIAMQGVRQADLRIGESCAVIGLGLLGQLSGLLLRASGVRAVGIDINASMVDMAQDRSVDLALNRNEDGIEWKIDEFTNGLGCDAVIITAASGSLDPVNFAGAVARKRGVVVVVGAVPTGFDREPHYYRKELQLRMSCSYGPGRYDPHYEEKGLDYPAAYVRWTENRNMQAFQDLIHSGKIDLSFLTTHVFKLDEAPGAYDLIMERSEPHAGILVEYDAAKHIESPATRKPLPRSTRNAGKRLINIGFIGAGSYAQSHLLPNIPESPDIALKGVMTATGTGARSVGERFGFEFCTTDAYEILENDEINTVFIASRHDSHAQYVLRALEAGKHVFVEKPLCLTLEELESIRKRCESFEGGENASAPLLMVGYNRRFSPFLEEAKRLAGEGPAAVVCRVNAGSVPPGSWIQDREFGGGRILGEVCHFIDTLTFLAGSLPVSLFAASLPDPFHLDDTLHICLKYANGSAGTVSYLANGPKDLPKERIEMFANGTAAVIDDFRVLTIHSKHGARKKKLFSQDKGQKNEILAFLQCIREGGKEIIPFEQIYHTSLATFKILDSIQSGQSQKL